MVRDIKIKAKYIAPSTGYFEIDNGKFVYRLMEQMASTMTQDKLVEFYEKEKQKGNPLPLNSIQTFGLLEDAVKSGNSDLMNHLHKTLRNCWVNTTSRAIYNLVEQDEVIHNYGTSDAYTITKNLVGRDGWIDSIDNSDALEPLLKTKDIKEINEISNSINQTPMYFWRINSKPSQKTERVVRFGVDGGRLGLIADRYPLDENPAFLVEKIK